MKARLMLVSCAAAFVFLVTAGMSCNENTADVPEVLSCDIGVTACTASTPKRYCKYNLPNKHYRIHRFPFHGDQVAWTAFVWTDWCYDGRSPDGVITSRHSTTDEQITHAGTLAGFYLVRASWWSSACDGSYFGTRFEATNCLTRREVVVHNPFSNANEAVCIGTRIWGFRGKNNNRRNITEHGCPGDSNRLARSTSRSDVGRVLERRSQAGLRMLSSLERRAVRRACRKETGSGGVLSQRCGAALRHAYRSLDGAERKKLAASGGA